MPDLSIKLNTPTTFPVNLAIDGTFAVEHTEPVYGELYGRFDDDPESSPIYLGSAVAGGTVRKEGLSLGTRDFRLFIIPKTDKAIESDLDFNKAVQTVFSPNVETLTPVLWATAPATNTQIFFGVGNYSPNAKYRQIQWSLASNFSSPTDIFHNIANTPNTQLDSEVVITRSTNLTNTETRYIRVRHSSNGDTYGAWSTPADFNVTFANSGGTGGSGDDPTPIDCFAEHTIFHLIDEEITFADLYRRWEKDTLRHNLAISFDGSGNQVEGLIANAFRVLKNKWLLAEFEGENFEVTHHHKFFTENGLYVPIKEMEIGARVLDAYGNPVSLLRKTERTGSQYFYNAHILDLLNYCVGKIKLRVHNLKEINE